MAKRIFVAGQQLTAAQLNAEVKTTFGGDGSDGALTISSGTTNIDLAGAQVVIKQYTSISITGTGKLTFSNPHANGTTIILKSQGDVTLTSSQAPMIDASSLGGAGGPSQVNNNGEGAEDGEVGTESRGFLLTISGGVAVRAASTNAGGSASVKPQLTTANSKYYLIAPGSGGASGQATTGNPASETSGAGGRGGGALVIECGGAWNFTTTGGISVAGGNGGNATGSGTQRSGGGGSGGGGGVLLALYNTLTANTGTVTVSGGTGGTAESTGISSGLGSPKGASGGGSITNPGTNGATGTDTSYAAGVAGGDGIAIVAQNKDIA